MFDIEKLRDLPNIGKELESQLNRIGIESHESLKEMGSKQAWLSIKEFDKSA